MTTIDRDPNEPPTTIGDLLWEIVRDLIVGPPDAPGDDGQSSGILPCCLIEAPEAGG